MGGLKSATSLCVSMPSPSQLCACFVCGRVSGQSIKKHGCESLAALCLCVHFICLHVHMSPKQDTYGTRLSIQCGGSHAAATMLLIPH